MDRDRILKIANNIATVPSYTAAQLGCTLSPHGESVGPEDQGVLLVNAAHRELFVAALLLFAGPDEAKP